MPTAMEILRDKGDHVFTTSPETRVIDAIHQMNRHKIGALVVCDGKRCIGMFTERDVLRRVAGEGLNPSDVEVSEVMTRDLVVCPPDAEVDEIAGILQQRRIRHLPVVDADGHLLGLISIGDINATVATRQEQQITLLNDYIYGRV